ncbi:serine/threonine-protein kinase 33 isoform X2 [Betta splendens]|uniref:Serine/threonine-protein kinase 33 isoform X2 n=1 Tax=Betta splendens TaxID=158456 RepID=A0A6P7M3Z9_BETSP|nr:serine/threonine-protein kinase 33 isoform X2 [Betta splendens]
MREADVTGLDMDMVSLRTTRDTLEKDVPSIRLEKDSELREIYQFGRKLGQGSFGVVYEATHIETQTKWAIKEVCRPAAGSSKVKMLEQEINILKQVNHACVIQLKEVYNTANMIYLVTELCTGGELNQLLRQKKYFTEDETRHIIRSLAEAVVYLHKKDIVHRDLKLENILVKNSEDDDGRINIKVTDFGLSEQMSGVGIDNIMTETCGTLIYMAPEMMSGRGYSQWCDVWSIGVVMYMLLCGEPPFVSKTKAYLLEEIMSKEVPFNQPIWSKVSDGAKTILTCLLKVDPAHRMSPSQLLENPWITGDTNVPATPSNVLKMMREHLKEVERTQTPEDLSFTSSEDTLGQHLVPQADAPGTECNHAKTSPVRSSRPCTALVPTKTTKQSGGSLQQDKQKNGPEASVTPSTIVTQAHASVKASPQSSAKQRRRQDKKDFSSGQNLSCDLSKSQNHRPFTSSKSKKPLRCSKANSYSE